LIFSKEVSVNSDITDQSQAEDEMRRISERFQLAGRVVSIGIYRCG
jgi:hypothetical protein